jgi:manganese transport protein
VPVSNIMAILPQSPCARPATTSDRDLAQAGRDALPRRASLPLWLLADCAIIATDIAAVNGNAIGLNLRSGIPPAAGVVTTAPGVLPMLWPRTKGFRWIKASVVTRPGVIAVSFASRVPAADPDWGAVIRGFAPTTKIVANPAMLWRALGILGATVGCTSCTCIGQSCRRAATGRRCRTSARRHALP